MNDDGTPKRLPWEDWRVGDDELTSGWMRATSPSGAKDFEGKVHWSDELGKGVRKPEAGQSDLPPSEAAPRYSIRKIEGDRILKRHGGRV